MTTITPQAMKNAYAAIEIIKGQIDSQYYRMEEAVPETGKKPGRNRYDRYVAAKDCLDQASSTLLAALDWLRYHE